MLFAAVAAAASAVTDVVDAVLCSAAVAAAIGGVPVTLFVRVQQQLKPQLLRPAKESSYEEVLGFRV